MPALLKLSRSIENLRDSFRSQPPTYEKKKNYKYKRVLGKGTFGKVLFAIWHDPGQLNEKRTLERRYPRKPSKRDVALKVVKKSNLKRGDKDIVISEVNVLKRVNHKNVMQFYEFFESCNNYYISFEYAAGGELFDRIKQRGGKFTEIDAKACVRSILHGVEYLHANGILHHDLKPENILLRSKAPDADIILADFGAARHVDYPDQLLYCDTGTYDYSPPEIFTHEGHGTKLDMWAVGVITHALLSGMMPFPNQTLSILKRAILRCELAFEGRYWEKVSSTAKEFICALIHADQIARLSASEALAHPWLSGESEIKAGIPSKSSESTLASAEGAKEKNDGATTVGVFPTKSIPDLPGLRENYSQIARARWRIAIGSAIAVNRLREGGSRAASRRRRTLELLDQCDDSERERGYDEYACDFDSEFASMSQVSLAMASTTSLTTYAERKSASLEVEANSPENLRELEKLVASRRLSKEDGKDVDVSDSSRSSSSASSYSSPSPEPSEPPEPESKSEPSEQRPVSALSTLPPPPTRPIPPPPFPRLSPGAQSQQHRIRPTLRPPSRSRGWSSSFSSSSSTESGSSLSASSAISTSPTTSSGGTYTSHSTAATSVMSMSLVSESTRSNSMCAGECDCATPVPNSRSTPDTKSKPPINSMKDPPSQHLYSHSRTLPRESRREPFGIINTNTKSPDILNELQSDTSCNPKSKSKSMSKAEAEAEAAPFDPEEVLDMYIGVQWRTSLSQISPELETSLRSFKERW
ncbi:CMK2_3 [Sanghuangporus sanghuang]